MRLYTTALVILISVFSLQVIAQDKNQHVRDNDQVFVIDISNVDAKVVDQLNAIRYASVLDYKEGETLILKASKDQSAKATESINNLVSDSSVIEVKKGTDYTAP